MDENGKCTMCGYLWNKHKHITYEINHTLSYVLLREHTDEKENRIFKLKQEQQLVIDICTKLSLFSKKYSIIPYNDDIIEYIRYFILEEQTKQNVGSQNKHIIDGLEQMINDYQTTN
ncbi:unnamed protein product [Didymodactylos carnosus]|uniref:Uncharacterized protein n=2 Tax=Didymodactylos carnosus TaxID=1234261 RepID=A0A8S2ECZ8_9BILA|nr:unnamed protein product [Didymodactylos carnosus]CAF4003642.1 unnamed protein product [Didymodactylos carnosus]